MSLEKQLMEDMKLAMKSGNKTALDTIRMLRAQIKTASIDKKDELDEAELAQVLQKEAKKRKEAMELYKQGNREDLFKKEESELEIISNYLPEQLSEETIDKNLNKFKASHRRAVVWWLMPAAMKSTSACGNPKANAI